jgi:hypothetical protein
MSRLALEFSPRLAVMKLMTKARAASHTYALRYP